MTTGSSRKEACTNPHKPQESHLAASLHSHFSTAPKVPTGAPQAPPSHSISVTTLLGAQSRLSGAALSTGGGSCTQDLNAFPWVSTDWSFLLPPCSLRRELRVARGRESSPQILEDVEGETADQSDDRHLPEEGQGGDEVDICKQEDGCEGSILQDGHGATRRKCSLFPIPHSLPTEGTPRASSVHGPHFLPSSFGEMLLPTTRKRTFQKTFPPVFLSLNDNWSFF